MKLSNIRDERRRVNPETLSPVNVKRGRVVGRSVDVHFYYRAGRRVFISDADLANWKLAP